MIKGLVEPTVRLTAARIPHKLPHNRSSASHRFPFSLVKEQLPGATERFKYSARQDWDKISRGLKPVYQAATVKEAEDRFLDFCEQWGAKYPAIVRLWEKAWPEFVPFLQFDREIRRIVCTTNAIESVNARIRKAVRARGHFPNEQAALKCVYLAVMALDPTGRGRARWTQRWKGALNAFDITFNGRLSAHSH